VRIAVSGICGAQINEIRSVRGPDAFLPHLLGHEGSGTVERVGDLVTKVEPAIASCCTGGGRPRAAPVRFRGTGRRRLLGRWGIRDEPRQPGAHRGEPRDQNRRLGPVRRRRAVRGAESPPATASSRTS
jgi:hypothetical protein